MLNKINYNFLQKELNFLYANFVQSINIYGKIDYKKRLNLIQKY